MAAGIPELISSAAPCRYRVVCAVVRHACCSCLCRVYGASCDSSAVPGSQHLHHRCLRDACVDSPPGVERARACRAQTGPDGLHPARRLGARGGHGPLLLHARDSVEHALVRAQAIVCHHQSRFDCHPLYHSVRNRQPARVGAAHSTCSLCGDGYRAVLCCGVQEFGYSAERPARFGDGAVSERRLFLRPQRSAAHRAVARGRCRESAIADAADAEARRAGQAAPCFTHLCSHRGGVRHDRSGGSVVSHRESLSRFRAAGIVLGCVGRLSQSGLCRLLCVAYPERAD